MLQEDPTWLPERVPPEPQEWGPELEPAPAREPEASGVREPGPRASEFPERREPAERVWGPELVPVQVRELAPQGQAREREPGPESPALEPQEPRAEEPGPEEPPGFPASAPQERGPAGRREDQPRWAGSPLRWEGPPEERV